MGFHWVSGAISLAVALILSLRVGEPPAAEAGAKAVVLGIAQDGGVPHIGCRQELCVAARRDPARRQRVASIGLVDGRRALPDRRDAGPGVADRVAVGDARRRRTAAGRCPASCSRTRTSVTTRASCPSAARRSAPAASPSTRRRGCAASCATTRPGASSSRCGHVELRELTPGRELALSPRLHVTPARWCRTATSSATRWRFRVRGPARARCSTCPTSTSGSAGSAAWRTRSRAWTSRSSTARSSDAAEIPGRTPGRHPASARGRDGRARCRPSSACARAPHPPEPHEPPAVGAAGARRAVRCAG